MRWSDSPVFARGLTADGFDLRVGLMHTARSWGWILYVASTMHRVDWGEEESKQAAKEAAQHALTRARGGRE